MFAMLPLIKLNLRWLFLISCYILFLTSTVQVFDNFLNSPHNKLQEAESELADMPDMPLQHHDQVHANMACMRDLLDFTTRWRYMLNIAGQEFPLRTNAELVRVLKIYGGYNDIVNDVHGKQLDNVVLSRTGYDRTGLKNEKFPPPAQLQVFKGLAYGAFSRAFVNFIINSNVSKELWRWLMNAQFADELYWNTLHSNLHISPPGGSAVGELLPPVNNAVRAVVWAGEGICHGMFVRYVCVLGIGDLPWIVRQPHLVANKFYTDDPNPMISATLDCVEEWLWNKTADPSHLRHFPVTYYHLAKSSWQNANRFVMKRKSKTWQHPTTEGIS